VGSAWSRVASAHCSHTSSIPIGVGRGGAKSKDQVAAAFRRTRERASRQARYASGKAAGVGYRLGGAGDNMPADDHTLEQNVKSEVLGNEAWRAAPVNVMVSNCVVELHGEVGTPEDIKKLEARSAE